LTYHGKSRIALEKQGISRSTPPPFNFILAVIQVNRRDLPRITGAPAQDQDHGLHRGNTVEIRTRALIKWKTKRTRALFD